MKSIQDINLFNNDDSFNKNKENSINTLMNDHNIITVSYTHLTLPTKA